MESPIKEFEHINSEFTITSIVALSIFLLALAVFLYWYRKRVPYYEKKSRQLYMLLLGFTMLMSFGVAVFSWLSNLKMQKIKIYKNAIELPEKRIPFGKIKNAYIYLHFEKSSLPSNIVRDTVKVLILEEKNGNKHAISEENYEIEGILDGLIAIKPENQAK